jgi:hypothetical protein
MADRNTAAVPVAPVAAVVRRFSLISLYAAKLVIIIGGVGAESKRRANLATLVAPGSRFSLYPDRTPGYPATCTRDLPETFHSPEDVSASRRARLRHTALLALLYYAAEPPDSSVVFYKVGPA